MRCDHRVRRQRWRGPSVISCPFLLSLFACHHCRVYLRHPDWMLLGKKREDWQKRTTHPEAAGSSLLLLFTWKRRILFLRCSLQKFLFTSLWSSVSIHKFTQSHPLLLLFFAAHSRRADLLKASKLLPTFSFARFSLFLRNIIYFAARGWIPAQTF